MSIIGLFGPACSGKETFAQLLVQDGYQAIKLEDQDFDALGHSVYNNWNVPTVIYPITKMNQIRVLKKRQYFYLIYIDADIYLRFLRYRQKHCQIEFSAFVAADDTTKYDAQTQQLEKKCRIRLRNDFESKSELLAYMLQHKKVIKRTFRPDWDIYFMKIAYSLKSRSNCIKKSVGAVLVDKYHRLLSTSYNGTPKVMKNCNEGGCSVCLNSDTLDLILYKCMCIHAEEGCILEQGMTHTRGSTLYTTLFPCVWCCKALLQAGVAMIVYDEMGSNCELSKEFLKDLIAFKQVSVHDYIY